MNYLSDKTASVFLIIYVFIPSRHDKGAIPGPGDHHQYHLGLLINAEVPSPGYYGDNVMMADTAAPKLSYPPLYPRSSGQYRQ